MVSLGLDNSKFNSGLKDSEKKTSAFGKSINKVGGMIAGAFATSKVFAFFKTSFKLYGIQADAEAKLRAQIEANGKASAETLDDYKRFASGLQGITTVGDETTLKLLQIAESMGVSTQKSKEAATGAIGLSKAFGISLETALRGVVLAQNGQYEMLQRYIPTLRTANTDTERAAALQKAMADGMKIAMAEVETGVGKVQQLSNAWGDFQESVGGAIAESGFFTGLLKEMTNRVQKLTMSSADLKIEKAFQDIDIEGKNAEDRIKAINSWLEAEKRTRDELIKKNPYNVKFGDYQDSLKVTAALEKELERVRADQQKEKNEADKEEIRNIATISEEIKNLTALQQTSTGSRLIEINNEIQALNKEIETLKSLKYEAGEVKPIQLSAEIKPLEAPQIKLPKGKEYKLPTKITTAGTIAESEGFAATQEYLRQQLLETQNQINATAATTQAYGSILGSVGQIASVMGNDTAATFANVASQVISSVAQMLPALFGQSIAGATAAGAAVPFPGNLVAIASGIAGVVSAFSGIGGGHASAGGGTVTTIDTRRATSPAMNMNTQGRQVSSAQQKIQVEVVGKIDNKTIALANKQGTKDLRR